MILKLIVISILLLYFLFTRQVIPEEYYFRFIGVFLMISLQLVLLLIWIIIKVNRLFQEYNFTITLIPDSIENDPANLNWKVESKQQLFMNKYTEEGKLALRTNEAKQRVQGVDYNFAQTIHESDLAPNPLSNHIQNTQVLLQTLDKCRSIMNSFNSYPCQFGHSLASICLNNEMNFVKVEEYHPCSIGLDQITDNQQQLLKNNKLNGGNMLRLPGWSKLIWFFTEMGTSFKNYLKEMQDSNTKFITYSYNKIEQEDQMMCTQITGLQKQIEDTKRVLVELNEQQKQATKAQQYEQLQPESAQAHEKWLYWLKKRYLQFINLEQTIKQNENKLKVMRQKVKHYRQNLNLLFKKHKNIYNSVLKMSLRGFLDSVFNSIQKSVQSFNETLLEEHTYKRRERTKVEQLIISANVHEMIAAEKKYQQQYFERVNIHLEQASLIEKGIMDLGYFIEGLIYTYQQFEIKIKRLMEDYAKEELAKFHIRIFEVFSQTNNKFIVELETFSKVNKKFIVSNLHQLRVLISKITRYKQTAEYELDELQKQSKTENVVYKYKTVQEKLLGYYECLQQHIEIAMDFRKVYLKHTNRIKKSMLLFIYQKLMDQRKVIQSLIESVDSKAFHRQISHIEIEMSHPDAKALEVNDEVEKEEEENKEEVDEEEHVSPQFLNCLNKMLFAFYTEWSVSHFFKTNIYQSLYSTLNDQPTEDFSQILISSVDFSGPAPRLNSLKQLKSEDDECLFQLNLSFYGSVNLQITTSYKIFQSVIPLSCRAHVTEMNITVRICFVVGNKGSGWYSFIGEPAARIDVVPAVGSFTIDYAAVRKLIQSFIMNILKKNVYPMKSPLRVPMYGEVVSKEEKKTK